MTRTHPLRSTILFMIAVIAGAFALSSLYHLGVAHAGVLLAAAPDPVVVAQSATDGGWALVASYGPLWGGALLIYALVQSFIGQQHVLAQGRLLAIITGAAMVGGSVLDWHFRGAPVAGIVVTLVMAIKLVWSPVVPGAAAAARSSQVGMSRLGVLLVVSVVGGSVGSVAMLTLNSCAAVKAVPGAAEHAIVDCAKADAPAIAALVARLGSEAAMSALGLGHIDWGQLATEALAQGRVVGGCALVEFIAAIGGVPSPAPAAQSVRAGEEQAVAAMNALERFRSSVGGGQWRIASGVM